MKISKNGIGLMGGTFDPPHNGHLMVAEWLSSFLKTDTTFFIPTNQHPFNKRNDIISAQHRMDMLQLAVKPFPNFEVEDFEIKRQQTSFTIDTIHYFEEKFPNTPLYYFIGADNLNDFYKWKDPLKILEKCYLVVYQRSGSAINSDFSDHPKVVIVDSPLINISSSHIRKRIKEKIAFKSLVPHDVFDYICKNKLYKTI